MTMMIKLCSLQVNSNYDDKYDSDNSDDNHPDNDDFAACKSAAIMMTNMMTHDHNDDNYDDYDDPTLQLASQQQL